MTSAAPGTNTLLNFSLVEIEGNGRARRGALHTTRGTVETPAFMPVGTQATVKTLHPDEVTATGAKILLANTYHLMLRPGADLIEKAGGLHRFMRWSGPILTDSGGFQVFSLATLRKVREEGVSFRSHIDGSSHEMTPERAVSLQLQFGSDIAMPLDHVIGLPAERSAIADAMRRTTRWLERSLAEQQRLEGSSRGTALFGICQGGTDPELRRESARQIGSLPVDGCAIGGLSVGEPKELMHQMVEITDMVLPSFKPRYLMGVGSPEDLWNGVARGVDLFDCVLPTRLARNAALFTAQGRISIRSARYRDLHDPIEPDCDCATCGTFTAAYLHHLFRAGEVLGLRLASVHNLRFLARQMEHMRNAIETGTFDREHRRFAESYRAVPRDPSPFGPAGAGS